MTPLLKKFLQTGKAPMSNTNLPLECIHIYREVLHGYSPFIYEKLSHLEADVGYSWLKANLSDEEFAEFIAMKLRGQVT